MDKKIKKSLVYTVLITLIIAIFLLVGFLTFEIIKPQDKSQPEQETKKEETAPEDAPDGLGSSAGSIGVSLMSIADAEVLDIQPDINSGGIPVMSVSHTLSAHVEARGLVKFNISSIPANSSIESANLKLYTVNCGVPDPTMVTASQITSIWDELVVTWNNKPVSSGGVSKNVPCLVPSYQTFNVKGIVENWVKNGQANYGIMVSGPDSGTWGFIFSTREGGTIPQRPQLEVNYYEPTSTPPDGNQGQENADTSVSNTTGSNNAGDMNMLNATGQEIQPPVFTHIIKNDEKIDAPINDIVEIKEDDSLETFGTSLANAKLKIYIKGIAYDAAADEKGNWSYIFDPLKLNIGEESAAQAQVLTEDGTNSMVIEMFVLKRVAGLSVEQSTSENPTFMQNLLGKYIYYLYGILIVLFIAMSVALFFLIRKKREKEKNNISEYSKK